MDLLRTLLVYMSMLVAGAGVNSPALTPVPQNAVTPAPTAWVTQSPIPTAAPAATATPSMTTLSINSRGEDVRRLQQRLADLGYLTGRVDGIFGRQTQQAVRSFQRANKLSVDGIAGRNTLNKLYNDPSVVRASQAPTDAPASAQLTVFYVSTTGATFNTDTITLQTGTRTVTPNASKVPRGYVLRSQQRVTVRVDNRGVASPASITFTYQPPALAQTVNVPIYYRSDTNQLLSQDYIAAPYGQSVTVFAQQNRVPQGFTLLTPSQLTVQVSAQGVPAPSFLTFIYRGPQVVTALVPVLYRNTQGDLITSTMMSLQPGTHTIAANDAVVPQGYTLEGSRDQQVTVSANGTAAPASVTFTYRTAAVTVSLPVHYVDPNGAMLRQDTVSVMTGPNTVTANDALVPGYQLTSARQVSVQVDANGRATPDKVVFTYKKPAAATVSVLYRDTAGKTLLDTAVTFGEGSHTVIANDSFVPAGYVLQSAREVPVTVRADGTASPTSITFTYKAPVETPVPTATPTPAPTATATPKPTEVPMLTAAVELRYRNPQGDLIGGETITLTGVGMHNVTAATTTIGNYVITDNTPQQVEVLANGTAQPNAVSFVFAQPVVPTAVPTEKPTEVPTEEPTAAPVATASVDLRYLNAAGDIIGGETITLTGAGMHDVTAPTTTIGNYVITDNTPQQVEVLADGTAQPSAVSFVFAVPATPEPVATNAPTTAPTDEPTEVPTDAPTDPPVITAPQLQPYQDMTIPEGSYPMFTGPGDSFISSTPEQVYTGGAARVWGSQAGWVMLGYDLDGQGNYRVGYVPQNLLPADMVIPELALTSVQTLPIVLDGAMLTEDPFGTNTTLQLPLANGSSVLVYGTVGDYAYVDSITNMARGFVPKAALNIQ